MYVRMYVCIYIYIHICSEIRSFSSNSATCAQTNRQDYGSTCAQTNRPDYEPQIILIIYVCVRRYIYKYICIARCARSL